MKYELLKEEEQAVRAIKNELHRHPETSWEEVETTALIRREIAKIPGMEIVETGMNTGVIALLRGGQKGRCVSLRADIDGLNVIEKYESDVMSEVPGKGHLCGHDFHTAGLLGAAKILSRNRDELKGTVLFIFQPAEETTNGAREIIKTGVFERFEVGAIFGLHNRPEEETGHVVVKLEPLMAAKINFKIVIHGFGGHGSMPHKCIDPIVCAAGIVQNVLTIPARNVDPMKSLVLSICSIHGGTPANLIVDQVEMTGSMRYHDPEVGQRALERLKQVVTSTADVFECRSEFEIVEQVPAVINSPELLETAQKAVELAVGKEAAITSESGLATEDFADYMQIVPGFFFWLGARKPGDTCFAWHNEKFHTDNDALKFGSQLLAACANEWLMK